LAERCANRGGSDLPADKKKRTVAEVAASLTGLFFRQDYRMDMIQTIAHQAIHTISFNLLSCQNRNGNAVVLKSNISIGISAAAVLCLHSVPLRAESAAELLKTSGVRGGLIVHVGCGDGSLTADLRAGEAYFVHGLDADAGNVENARATIRRRGLYGPVSVEQWTGGRLPYAENLVNLIVADDPGKLPMVEVMRVLTPGGVALIAGKKTVKPWPADLDEWSHFLYDAGNTAVSKDQRVGPPERLQWTAGPLWTRSHEITPSVQGMVSAGGRLFYAHDEGPIGLFDDRLPGKWSLIARDAFNGRLLWKRSIPPWSSDIPWLSYSTLENARMVAGRDSVYVDLGSGQPVTAFDAATGEPLRRFAGTGGARHLALRSGVLLVACAKDAAPRSRQVRKDTAFSNLRAFEAATDRLLWESDIAGKANAIALNDRSVYCTNGREVVCLDLATGAERWAVPVEGLVFWNHLAGTEGLSPLVANDEVVLAVGPGITALDADDGTKLWQVTDEVMVDRQGKFKVTAILMLDGLVWPVFSDKLLDLKTGKETRSVMKVPPRPHHHRCHPVKATSRFILTAWRGMEFLDVGGRDAPVLNDWVRGTCRLGLVPANGMLYSTPNACHCYAGTKLMGFNALIAGDKEQDLVSDPEEMRLVCKSPANGDNEAIRRAADKSLPVGRASSLPSSAKPQAGSLRHGMNPTADRRNDRGTKEDWVLAEFDGAWPTYRHDARRSGTTSTSVDTEVHLRSFHFRDWTLLHCEASPRRPFATVISSAPTAVPPVSARLWLGRPPEGHHQPRSLVSLHQPRRRVPF
jgi:outer membrane protein assembly factor BamB